MRQDRASYVQTTKNISAIPWLCSIILELTQSSPFAAKSRILKLHSSRVHQRHPVM